MFRWKSGLSGVWIVRVTFVVCLLGIVAALGSPRAAAVDKDQAKKDWAALSDLTMRYQMDLNSRSNLEERGPQFIDDWNAWKKEFEPLMEEFTARYGKTSDDVVKAFEGIQKPLDAQRDLYSSYASASAIDIAQQEKKYVGWAVESGEQTYQRWKRLTPDPTKIELKMNYAERALRYFNMAKSMDPKGDYDDHISQAQAAYDETRPQWEKKLKELKWPGHDPAFAGPGDPRRLAEAALDYLKSGVEWSKPEYDDEHIPLAACVTGKDWQVYKKVPLTGQPTQYSLDFFVAFAGKKDPKIAYGYNMVFYTKEEAGVEKKPPFRFANSRQYAKYKMLMSNVPKGGGVAAKKPTSGFFGWLIRLVLSLTLILAGLIASAPVLKQKVAALGGVCDALAPARGPIGIVVLVVGVLAFLRALLLHFAPLTDLLPHAAAIVLGLILAKDIVLPKPAPAGDSDAQAQTKLGCMRGKIEKLEQKQVLIGLVSLALGIIHLLLGGIWLF